MSQVQLVSKDNESVSISSDVIKMSGLLSDMFEEEMFMDEIVLPIDKVNKEILDKVLCYCTEHYKNRADHNQTIEKPLSKPLDQLVSKWDMEFLQSLMTGE
jgi:hypothetical protein